MEQQILVGKVKYFHPKKGYGFITITDGPYEGASIFVHHSSIQVGNHRRDNLRYLVENELVDFVLKASEDKEHEFQASQVRGHGGNVLYCEHRQPKATTVTTKAYVANDQEPNRWRLVSNHKNKNTSI